MNTKTQDELVEKIRQLEYKDINQCCQYALKLYNLKNIGIDMKLFAAAFICRCKRRQGAHSVAQSYIKECLRSCGKDVAPEINGLIYCEAAIIFCTNKDYYIGGKYSFKSLRIAEQINDEDLLLQVYNVIAGLYMDLDYYEKALEYLFKCKRLNKHSNEMSYMITMLNIAEVYLRKGEYISSYKYLSLLDEQSAKQFQVIYNALYINSAHLHRLMGEHKEAQEKLGKITLSKLENIDLLTEYYIEQYYLFFSKGEEEEAFINIEKADNLTSIQGKESLRKIILNIMCQYYEEKQQYKMANMYYKQYYYLQEKRKQMLNNNLVFALQSEHEKQCSEQKMLSERLEKERLIREKNILRDFTRDIENVQELCKLVVGISDRQELPYYIYSQLSKIMPIKCISIGVYNINKNEVETCSYCDDSNDSIKFCNRHPLIGIQEHIDTLKCKNGSKGLCVPLVIKNRTIGFMYTKYKQDRLPLRHYKALLEIIADFTAISINNIQKSSLIIKKANESEELLSQLELVNKKLKHLSQRDFLTQLYNKRVLMDKLKIYFDKGKGKNGNLSIIFMDIDYFKEYNDFYGHIKGDECIIAVANAIKEGLADRGYLARYGGDEFIAIIRNKTTEESMKIGKEILKCLNDKEIYIKRENMCKKITLSIGIVSFKITEDIRIKDVMADADNALYESKKNGRNKVTQYIK